MSKLILMKGLPASGKSTKAQELIIKYGNTVRINKDLLRTMLHFDKFTGVNEGNTQKASREIAKMFLSNQVNVIIDDTNLNPNTMQSWKDFAREMNAKIEYHDIDTPVEECLARNSKREKQVGYNVIKQMAMQFKGYMKGEKVIVCDIDGTIADITHRLQYGKGETKDWDKFFSLMGQDTLRTDIVDKVKSILNNETRLIFVTARPDNYRDETMKWLSANLINTGIWENFEILLMRPSNDKRPDTEVKLDIYKKYLKDLDIQVVFDDRPSVIRMWRAEELKVFDCGSGDEF